MPSLKRWKDKIFNPPPRHDAQTSNTGTASSSSLPLPLTSSQRFGSSRTSLLVPGPSTGPKTSIAGSTTSTPPDTGASSSKQKVQCVSKGDPLQNPDPNRTFQLALVKAAKDLEPSERTAFLQAFDSISLEQTIQTANKLKTLEEQDARLRARRVSRPLEPAIRVLEQFMASIAIGIQQSPEISSLVVGGVRLLIDLVAKFVKFYSKLSRMISELIDYLEPLKSYDAALSEGDGVQNALVGVYSDLLRFFREARLVFVDRDGNPKKFSHFRTFVRVQWEPFEDKFEDICSSFTHHTTVLQYSAQAQQLKLSNQISSSVDKELSKAEKERERVKRKEKVEERRQFLEWISTIDYEESFNELIKQRHPGTGTWILKQQGFKSWLEGSESSLLWCFGNPGAGKSILASVVLDDVTKYEMDDPDTFVIFAYYNYRHPERHDLKKLLGSFVRQLCSKKIELPSDIQDFYLKNYRNGRKPNSDDLKDIFFKLVGLFKSNLIVIIDALDECETRYRGETLEFFEQLSCQPSSSIKLFVTSRRENDIKQAFERFPLIEIDSERVNEDIKAFLHDEINQRIAKKSLIVQKESLKDDILDTLASRANGMFLWAKLQLDSICKQTRDCDIRDELNHLPRTLYETYDRILERITKEQPDNLQELARRILMWILYAERPLHIDELIEAVAIDTGVSTHDGLKERVYNEDTIFKVTGNLISFNRHHDWRTVRTVKFIHYSVQEYFTNSYHFKTNSQLSNYFTDPYSGHRELASSCMKYLQLDIFAQGPCSRKGEWDDKWRTDGKFRNTLAYYSSFCFDKHIKQLKGLPEDVMIQIESILDKDSTTIGAIIQLRRFGASHFGESEILHNSNLGPAMSSKTLIYSSYLYDFPQFTCIDNRWSKLPMALFILQEAIRKRSERDVYQLLDAFSLSGMNINERDFFGKTPLMLSVIRGHVGITEKLLVDLGADVDLYHSDWFTAFTSGPEYAECTSLYSVCTEGHIAIVELLLKHGADVNLISCSDTPLGKCAYLDNVFIMKLLLKHGAHVNLTPSSGCELWYTALEWACMGNSLNAVKFLLDKEAIITPKAVRIACKECEDGLILDLLLRRGGKATSKALEKATKYKRYERCVYLLAHGAIITPEALKQSWPTEKLNPWIEIEDESGIIKLFKDKVTSRGVTPKTFEEAEKLRVEEMKIFEEAKKLWLEDVKYTSDKRDSFQFDRYIQPLWDSL